MRPHSRTAAALATAVVAVVCVALTVSGCAPAAHKAAAPKVHHVVLKHAAYPRFPDYPNVRVIPNQVYERPHGNAMLLDVCLPANESSISRPAVLALHGGGWTAGNKTQSDFRNVCRWLASAGYVAVSINYRLAPKYVYPDAIHDAEHAVEWLREPAQVARYSIDPTRIGVLGSSAGGDLAALLGTSGSGSRSTGHRVAAVVDLSGPINLTAKGAEQPYLIPAVESYLGCESLEWCPQAKAASPDTHIDHTDPPFFISNSTNELIPLSQPEKFIAHLRNAGVSVDFVEVTGTAHAIQTLHTTLRERIIAFLRANLGDPPVEAAEVAGQ
jgi:acetyl esterase